MKPLNTSGPLPYSRRTNATCPPHESGPSCANCTLRPTCASSFCTASLPKSCTCTWAGQCSCETGRPRHSGRTSSRNASKNLRCGVRTHRVWCLGCLIFGISVLPIPKSLVQTPRGTFCRWGKSPVFFGVLFLATRQKKCPTAVGARNSTGAPGCHSQPH